MCITIQTFLSDYTSDILFDSKNSQISIEYVCFNITQNNINSEELISEYNQPASCCINFNANYAVENSDLDFFDSSSENQLLEFSQPVINFSSNYDEDY